MSQEKELPASGKKRSDLRNKGQIFKSMDVTSTAMLLVALLGLLLIGTNLAQGFGELMTASFRSLSVAARSPDPTSFFSVVLGSGFVLFVLVLILIAMAVGAASQILQVGFLVTAEPLQFRAESLNPVEGFKRLFSLKRLVQLIFSILKLVLILFFVYSAIHELMLDSVFTRAVTIQELGDYMIRVTWAIGWRVVAAMTVLSIADFLYQQWQWEKDNRMSFQEMRDEFRNTEGSPEVKAKMRALMRRKSIRRMMEDMASATIVVTNPTHFCVAMRYVKGETPTPVIVAKGQRLVALRLKERARELGLPMFENKPLAQGLFKHGVVGEPIPVIYFEGVAALLIQLYRRGFVSRAAGNN